MGGLLASQTISVFGDKVAIQTTEGIYKLHHLTWLESLGDLSESKVGQESSDLNTILNKARKIYVGEETGYRIINKEQMRDQLMEMIITQVSKLLVMWEKKEKVKPNLDHSSQLIQLIRVIIEFCIEISQPDYLFGSILNKL